MNEDMRTVSNASLTSLQVVLEPWGMPYTLPPGQAFRLVARSPQPGCLELIEAEDTVWIYAWPGATVQLFNGREMVDDFSVAVPDLPPDMSTRSFIEGMSGHPDEQQRKQERNSDSLPGYSSGF